MEKAIFASVFVHAKTEEDETAVSFCEGIVWLRKGCPVVYSSSGHVEVELPYVLRMDGESDVSVVLRSATLYNKDNEGRYYVTVQVDGISYLYS